MNTQDEIVKVFDVWGLKLVEDLKAELDKMITHNGGQASDLSLKGINYKVVKSSGLITFQLSMYRYWEVIEKGRGAGKKAPPTQPIADWIKRTPGLNSKLDQILLGIQVKHRGISSRSRKGIVRKRGLKQISHDLKVKRLSWMIARSIGKKGIKPRPFYHKVVNEARMNELKEMLKPVIKKQFILDIKEGWQ